MRTRLATGFVMLAAFAVGVSAQVSLSSAVGLSLHNDPKVRMSEAAVKKAEAALAETHDVYLPSVVANGGYGAGTGVPSGLPVVFSLSSQSLFFNFSQHDNIRAAASGLEAANLALRETRDQVAEDVVVTYLNLDSDQQRQVAMTQEYGYATRLVSITQDRVDAGQDTRMDLLQAKKTAAQIHLDQLHLEDEIATLSDHLSRLIGLQGNQLTTVSNSIPELPPINTLTDDDSDSFGIRSAVASARSKQELAFGLSRFRLRPQISLGANYSRIDTGYNDYTDYYPNFKGKSENAFSIYFSAQIPLYDRKHQDEANEAAAEASRAYFEAEDQRNQFLEGRFKLRHSTEELSARSDLAEIDRDLAQEQLNAVLAQLTANSASDNRPQLTPKDEQNARLQERARTIDLLDAQFQLEQAQVNLMRQTGQLDAWLKAIAAAPENITASPVTP